MGFFRLSSSSSKIEGFKVCLKIGRHIGGRVDHLVGVTAKHYEAVKVVKVSF